MNQFSDIDTQTLKGFDFSLSQKSLKFNEIKIRNIASEIDNSIVFDMQQGDKWHACCLSHSSLIENGMVLQVLSSKRKFNCRVWTLGSFEDAVIYVQEAFELHLNDRIDNFIDNIALFRKACLNYKIPVNIANYEDDHLYSHSKK